MSCWKKKQMSTRYERSVERAGYKAGHYERGLASSSGQVSLKMLKLKGVPFETAIIERCRRRESSVEEAIVEMYLAGVSVRRVEDITEALWGAKVSASTVSSLNQKAYENIEKWRSQTIEGEYPYVYINGILLKCSWLGRLRASACWWLSGWTAMATGLSLGQAKACGSPLRTGAAFSCGCGAGG